MATIKELLKQNPEGKFRLPDWTPNSYIYLCLKDGVFKEEDNRKFEGTMSGNRWELVREPREWTIEETNGSLVWYPCGPLLKPGETIKLREVL